MPESILSIEALENDLKYGQGQLAKAQADRLRAHEIEDQWSTEVTSLKNLIDVRRKRLGAAQPNNGTPKVADADLLEDCLNDLSAKDVDQENHISHVEWIYNAVAASREKGMSPPEILKASAQAGITMHKNYPYVVLRSLVEKKKVVKREDRYYAA